MKMFFKNYFNFNKSERHTVIVLLILIFLVFTTLLIVRNNTPKTSEDFSYLDERMDSLFRINNSKGEAQFVFSDFDPNTVSIKEMMEMGISKKNAETLSKYRKYHFFKNPEELKKLYFMEEELYAQLEPFVKIVQRKGGSSKKKYPSYNYKEKKEAYSSIKPDINTADTTDLKKVFGIGSYLARQIIWYRKRLGGFVNKEQLREVKGMRAESYERIKDKVTLSEMDIIRINMNDAEWKQIVQHPYISKDQTNRIVKYRKEFGTIMTLEELVIVEIFTKQEEKKLKPYFKFLPID